MEAENPPNTRFAELAILFAARNHAAKTPGKPAVIDVKAGRAFKYFELLAGAAKVQRILVNALSVGGDLQEQRIAYLVPSGAVYVQIQWGIWATGGVAVPLCTTHPFHELEYAIADSKPSLVFLHRDFAHHKSAISSTFPLIQVLIVPESLLDDNVVLPAAIAPLNIDPSRRALIIYTSGTTSKPKGCVSTHANIAFQATSLINAWKYSPSDHIIHVLPLHHIHGIINGLTATLIAGGTVEMHPKFDASVVWKRWAAGNSTMFMAVPTVYSRLNAHFTQHIAGTDDESKAIEGAQRLRLVVSGSAALPMSVKTRFREITGQVLLERYGMSEIGMGMSCLYDNADGEGRPDGSVGWPLDGVRVRLVAENGEVIQDGSQTEGEIQIKGPNVFKEYWEKPEATAREFTEDGFFKTGDIAYRRDDGAYFVRGRSSVDIIKSGGYKVSALDVEREILSNIPDVKEVAVVGIPDDEWGEKVAAVLTMEAGKEELELKAFRDMLRSHLAPYKIPTLLAIIPRIERNAMGKVNKKQLAKDVWPSSA
ncbi:hypothetical protein DRE_01009 [Drechslerella stenobrocha 248]|uniref:Uncharacterized protein n=1 Tax=Drechslerella stenobrocha 248 TaxID=1043628 RepID=W7I7J7_9PEZI|nr:hypothetical protein DRE_01009 [Drechslerella stenobrocha 248]